MESKTHMGQERDERSGTSQGASTTGTGPGNTTSESTGGSRQQTASATRRAKEGASELGRTVDEASRRGAEMYDQTKQVVTDAYGKATEAVNETYDQALRYGREHPGQLTLVAFGAGIAVGILLASSSRRSRTQRIAEPVVDAISRVALEFLR